MSRDLASAAGRVRWAKGYSGRTWQQLGTAVGCSHAALVQWSQGQTDLDNAKVGLVVAYARETGVSLLWLLTGSGVAVEDYPKVPAIIEAAALLVQERPALVDTGYQLLEALRKSPS
jgi:hypothetical protein